MTGRWLRVYSVIREDWLLQVRCEGGISSNTPTHHLNLAKVKQGSVDYLNSVDEAEPNLDMLFTMTCILDCDKSQAFLLSHLSFWNIKIRERL